VIRDDGRRQDVTYEMSCGSAPSDAPRRAARTSVVDPCVSSATNITILLTVRSSSSSYGEEMMPGCRNCRMTDAVSSATKRTSLSFYDFHPRAAPAT